MTVETRIEPDVSTLAARRLNEPPPGMVPNLGVISGAPQPGQMDEDQPRPFIIALGKKLRGLFDRLIGASSRVPTAPVLDSKLFSWTQLLIDNWEAIRDEARAAALVGQAAPPLAAISPDHRGIAEKDSWRSYFIYGYGYGIEENMRRCPRTTEVVERIPGLNSAFFSILAPGTHIPDHRGVTKGLITCHLGLIVPEDGDIRMRVHDQMLRWGEGEVLVFDDTYRHEVWNDSAGTRVVLLIQFERPLGQPGKWFSDLFLGFVRRSAFVQEARDNVLSWNAAIKQLDG